MVSVFQDLKLKMERVVETNTLTHTQQEVSLGMHICLFIHTEGLQFDKFGHTSYSIIKMVSGLCPWLLAQSFKNPWNFLHAKIAFVRPKR